MSGRRIIIFALLLAAIAGGGWWWANRAPPPLQWQGYAEADYVKVGPTQQGLLMSLAVRRGSKVTAGAALFDQDDTADLAAGEQATRQLRQAEEQLANLQASGKVTEIQQAEANLMDAQAARDKIQSDLKRNEALVKTNAVSAQLVDQERADLRSANAKVQGLEAALAQMRAPLGREREIKAQQAATEAFRAAVDMSQWRLDQRHVMAPVGGIVADVLARPGETIPAGGAVVSLLPPENIFVRFFVPEPRLAEVHIGDRVKLVCDNCPIDLAATISFISPQAEYTPPVIYSESIRAKLVYMVEARPSAEQAAMINPGQPVAVRPVLATAQAGQAVRAAQAGR
jgi:HlyD family secretion protein